MPYRSDDGKNWDEVQARIIGLGERSVRKTYYPQLKQRVDELERFRGLLDQTPDVILMLDLQDWTIVDTNRAAKSCLSEGIDLKGKPLDQALPYSTIENLKAMDGTHLSSNLEVALGSGEKVYPAEITFRQVVLGGKQYGVVVARDISKRKKYETRLERKASEEQALGALLRLALESIDVEEFLRVTLAMLLGSVPWLRLLPAGGIFLANKGADGVPYLRLVAQHGLSPVLQSKCAQVQFGHCMCGRAASQGEILHATCVDERHETHYEGMADHGHYNVPFFDQGETLGVVVFYLPPGHQRNKDDEAFLRRVSDVLSMGVLARLSEDEITRTVRELESSQSDIARLAFMASNDLQEPMRNILSTVQQLERSITEFESRQQLTSLSDSAKLLGNLVEGILDYTQHSVRDCTMETFDLHRTLDSVLDAYSSQINEGNITVLTSELPSVFGDERQIYTVFENLISNAMKFQSSERVARIKITADQEDGMVVISIADNGLGFDMQHKDKVFEPLQRIHSSADYPGIGMGLTIVRKIIERHGGQVDVDSTLNQGTRFTFTLPKG